MTSHQTDSVYKYLLIICNLSNIQYHFQPTHIILSHGVHFDPNLPHKTAHSDPNPYSLLFPVAHFNCLSPYRNCKLYVTGFVRTFVSVYFYLFI